MPYNVTVRYSESLIKSVTRQYILKLLGWDYFFVLAMLISYFVYEISQGNRSWLVGVLGTVIVISTAIAFAVWTMQRRRSLAIVRHMADPVAKFQFDEDGIDFESDLGSGRIRWNAIRKVMCFPDALLLFVDRGVYSTVPTEFLTEEVMLFVRERLARHSVSYARECDRWFDDR
jgi:hypothetical protein